MGWSGVKGCVLQDLTMHINVSSEKHHSSVKQLLNTINNNPETVNELDKWGLEISKEVLTVSLAMFTVTTYYWVI